MLLSVGRLSKEKGHVDLIHAFARIREMAAELPVRLVLVGEGPERRNIELACRALKVSDDVTLVGQQSEVGRYYAAADLFLLTSYSEGSPNVLLEAMVSGIPVIATSVGGVPEIATNEENALLVPKGNPQAIASAAVRTLRDPQLRARLAQKAANVSSRHSPATYFQSMLSFFARVAKGKGSLGPM
jgi:glycosyltransferase involved in cell wall biosynthesis